MKMINSKLSLEEGLTKEWVITNGIGGFASSTILGANTRRYHGLLVAPFMPPAKRYLLLSKVDESISLDGRNYILYTNVCKNYISDGYKHLESFEKKYVPKFCYKIENTVIEKTISMVYGKNTVCILYKIKNQNSKTKFTVTPIVNFRDFHAINANHEFKVEERIDHQKVKIIVDEQKEAPMYMKLSEGNYIEHHGDTFRNMFYLEEEKRGFFPEENHAVVGRYEVELEPGEEKEISFIFSLEEDIDHIDSRKIIEQEEKRLEKFVKSTKLIEEDKKLEGKEKKEQEERNELIENLIIATDNFIVERPSFGLHTIIAGYPWFLDWGRDSLIAFEGLLLVTKQYEIAKEVLLTFTRDIKCGLVPNGYAEGDNRPLYNSVDSSLLLFEEVNRYLEYTSDETWVYEYFYSIFENIIASYQNGINLDDNNIYLDRDGLIHSGTENTQNTWMDAKVEGFAVTPRNGKAVEINSMWYNALMIMGKLSEKKEKEKAEQYYQMAEKTKRAFERKFYNKDKQCLFDVVGEKQNDSKIRPNQLFSLSLSYPVISPDSRKALEILETVTKKLYTKHGLKTLAKGEKNYVATYEGDGFRRDMSYHQGITWPWLFGLYYNTLKNMKNAAKGQKKKAELEEKYQKFVKEVYKVFKVAVEQEGCLGSISELYDSISPYLPKGTVAQAWSVAEILRIVLEA